VPTFRHHRGDVLNTEPLHTAIVGAGFSGLCVASRLKAEGFSSFVVLEKSDALGGTWRDNSYPGCACDVPSVLYSVSGSEEWPWTRQYASQKEILNYLRAFAKRHELDSHLRYGREVLSATWDDARALWTLTLRRGQPVEARILVLAVGPLHIPIIPKIQGIDAFRGHWFHSAAWNHAVSLQGKNVALVGTGASAIQIVPEIAPLVSRLTVFQRTPPWIMPRGNRPLSRGFRDMSWRGRLTRKVARLSHFAMREALTFALRRKGLSTALLQKVALAHLRAQVHNSDLRKVLHPDYTLGCKRILLSSEYYPALTRENVSLVTDAIASASANALLTERGVSYPADVLIFATGFQPNGYTNFIDIRGRQGRSLLDAWRQMQSPFLGLSTHGFPNLFTTTGPNTGLGHSSILLMIEAQADHIVEALKVMKRYGHGGVEVAREQQRQFSAEIHRRLSKTIWQQGGCSSWYHDARGRNAAIWPGTSSEYRRRARKPPPYIFIPTEAHTNPETTAAINAHRDLTLS